MNKTEAATLSFLCAALHGQTPADPGLEPEEWQKLLRLSERHKLLPLILDAAWSLPSCRAALSRHSRPSPEQNSKISGKPAPSPAEAHGAHPSEVSAFPAGHSERSEAEPKNPPVQPDAWRTIVFDQVGRQAIQENEFLNLILALRERGLEPLVVKGAVCRKLYPKPLLRPSVDDDLLIPPDQAAAFHAALLELGLTEDHGATDPNALWELSYHKPDSPLYIELHTCLFDPESPIFSGFNGLFADAFDAPDREQVQDVELLTLEPNLHLLFLILHAYKHFLHSGFGLRIVSDICLFSRGHAAEIDFPAVLAACTDLRCERFAAAVFRIGEKYLDIAAPEAFGLPVDEAPLLADVLSSGNLGEDIDRLHSAHITLQTVAADRLGARAGGTIRNTVFLPASALSGRYPYLKKCPWLLPVAWVSRTATYAMGRLRRKSGAERPAASLRIGKNRVDLLRAYHIID